MSVPLLLELFLSPLLVSLLVKGLNGPPWHKGLQIRTIQDVSSSRLSDSLFSLLVVLYKASVNLEHQHVMTF